MNWSPEFELDYVQQTTREALVGRLREFAAVFELGAVPEPSVALDVGCGPVGGMFSVLPWQCRRIAADPLIREYETLGWLPDGVEAVEAFAHRTGIRSESVDVAFCIEALDHCADMGQFRDSQVELARVLRPGGELFFMLPARPEGEHDGHPCNPCGQEVISGFDGAGLAVVRFRYPRNEGTWLRLKKR